MLTYEDNEIDREEIFLFYSANITDDDLLPLDFREFAIANYLRFVLMV